MKNSKAFFFTGSVLLFFWIIGGFSPYIGWESRLFKILLTAILGFVAWKLKNSENPKYKKSALIIVLLLATATAYAEPYVSHAVFGHHHHHFFCGK
ncbi:MAG TPA: hypothetical protein DF712_19310 [Balneola sp.]|jgi:hypothetical protein|nr:hypothetical protein [Bacteroidota bacterium]MAC06003.1 hypothetical protein [Balneola sp.]MAO77802.1 hypothetical protein [Balneola sp.]MBF63256.1 hypothetical protein [Balneola sp.]HAH52592.1 hypothetical protein [Balneola sp.]|tara:strand:- start:2898 stop:3185 length:288 start_codon:yes stop_codon:yes gene_type:complete